MSKVIELWQNRNQDEQLALSQGGEWFWRMRSSATGNRTERWTGWRTVRLMANPANLFATHRHRYGGFVSVPLVNFPQDLAEQGYMPIKPSLAGKVRLCQNTAFKPCSAIRSQFCGFRLPDTMPEFEAKELRAVCVGSVAPRRPRARL